MSQRFPRLDIKSMINKRKKKDEFNLIKIKNFCFVKDPVKKMRRQTTKWEKIFANPNHISNKRLVSRI